MNLQQQQQQKEEESSDDDHTGFVPPAPNQEADKYVQWKQKRQLLDEEKKLRQKKQREQKRLEKSPVLSKIESINEDDMQQSQWYSNDKQINQYSQSYNNSNNQQFSQNLGSHGVQESDNMDNILNEMHQSGNQQY